MGNEASQEGGGPPGSPGSAAVSAPPGSEQLPKPSNGAPAGGAPAINSQAGKPPQPDVKAAPKPATQPPVGVPSPSKGPEPLDNRSLKVDPSVGGAVTSPTSPYSVPQIAPMPSSKLCPVCKTTDLSAAKDQASANTCTQCRSLVCSQCGFNPNPHLTEVQEWLCLNCQMQRALGMDMTTTHSKSPQQTPSPSHQAKPEPHTQPVKSSGPPKPDTQTQSKAQPPGHTLAKAPSQPDLSRSSPMHHPPQSRPDQARSAGSSPSKQPPEQPFGKLFGFGATLLNQASNLMTADPVAPSQPQPSPSKGPLGPAAGTPYKQTAPSQLAPKPKEPEQTKCNCPLCKTELNVSNISEPPNYSICTQCHSQVCNMCGFNPTPHLVEKKEWLCLNCQTQRLMSGELGEQPFPASQPPLQKHPPTSQQQPSLQLKGVGQPPTSSLNLIGQPMKPVDAQESSRSPQSLSDTGYSSDGISSSQSEITGLIKEDETKLNKRGFGQSSHPSHSENTKTEISVPPLHCKALSDGQELPQDIVDGEDKRQRPHSLSISQDEKREEYKNILNRDVHEPQKEMADEDFMRRQILEMSADENEEYDEHGLQKNKKAHRHSINSGKDRQQVTHHSHRYVQGNEESSEVHISSREDDDMMSSQGGLRRFKTIELTTPNSDLNLDREPELEMESLTGSPDERSKGEYSSTIPATTPSYTSGTSPTSVSSMEEDSDSSPSRRQRLEEAKQQRKARHRSHGPLLPTIEDSSEEDELREEEELLKEQEKMREVEQHRIRSTARKAKRDKEELRAQRRRERSKTPPSNLSPIEDASPTEELRQAAEMEELHRSSCSEYSPSIDSEAEGFEMMTSKLYKSGSEYNLPSFMSLYSPTEKTSSTDKTTKKPEDAEIMKKAMLQNQQQATQREQVRRNQFEAHNNDHSSRTQPGEVKPPQSSMLSSHQQPKSLACSTQEKHIVDKGSRTHEHLDQANSPLTPGTSPTQLNAPGSFSMSGLPDVRVTQHFSKEGQPSSTNNITGSTPRAGLQNKGTSSRLSRQQSSQEPQPVVITQRPEPAHPTKPATVNSSTSPLASPTKLSRQKSIQGHTPTPSSQTPAHQKSAQHSSVDSVYNYQKTISGDTVHGSLPADKISLCRISTVPGTSRVVEQGQKQQTAAIVDLRTPFKSTPIIMTDQGMDLTSLASDARRYSVGPEIGSNRHSTIVQPLIMNLNATEQPHVTPTTASVTVAASMFTSNLKQPVIYGDPLQSRVDIGQCVGSAVCLTQNKITITDPSIPKIDACLEDLGIQQQQVQMQQLKLQQQQQKLEQELQQHHQQQASFARYNLPNKVNPVPKKDVMVTQTSTGQAIVSISSLPRAHLPLQVTPESISSPHSQDIFCGVPLELKNKPTAMNLTMEKTPVMMVQLDGRGLKETTVTHLVKEQNHLPQDVLDLTGQIKQETQAACCDVVYKIPFGGSCKGPFAQKSKVSDDMEPSRSCPASPAPHFSGSLSPKPVPDAYQCQEYAVGIQGMNPSHKPNPLTAPEKLQPSISDASLAVTAMPYYLTKHNPQVDVSPARHAYEGGSLGASMQYGSYTDLRQESISMNPHVPLRRYGSMSNINTDYRYSFRDLSNFQESNLAQYSATTAREIGRMCAALNSMEPNMGRYGNPELLPYGPVNGSLTRRVAGLQQGLHPVRANMMYGPDGRQSAQSQSYANLINARQAAIRALYPPAVRTADGMIFSTINTPIASTLPITTQPAPVLQPVQQGVYRPYQAGSMTAVPLSSLTRLPLAPPRMPLSTQSPYRYPTPTNFPVVCVNSGAPLTSTPQDTPVYLGKPLVTSIISSNTVTPVSTSVPDIHKTSIHTQSSDMMSANEQQPQASIPGAQPQPQIFNQPQMLTQTQAQALLKPPVQTHMLQTHHALQPPMQTQADVQGQHQLQTLTQLQTQPQTMLPNVPQATPVSAANACIQEKGKEEERLRQQEHLLQLERERVELEKLRQLRLHEELERDRLELQRRREKEQMLVQHEIQQLQSIKHQVLQQQQAERETQLVLQREQLAQQRMQLDQIQSLQQQLQQQLEEQKRQKTIAAEASATTTQGSIPGVSVVGGAVPPGFSIVCDQTGIVLQDFPPELQRTIGQNVQFWQPYGDGKLVQGVITPKSLPSSTSDMSLKNEEHLTVNAMKKLNSMPRLRDDIDAGDSQPTIKRIADSSVQTDEEDAEEKFMVSRRRRTRRIADCSVQTDDEDQAEWEQPVRRRRSRFSKHSEPSLEPKADISKVSSSSIAIQTTNDSACQTEPDQLERISPAIHINTLEPKTEFVHYISAPERTQKGESLACQTEPEVQSQGVVIPQLSVSTTISPYTPSVHLVGSGTTDPLSPRLQGPTRFERRKPDPLEMSYQNHLQNESLSTLTRQAPKSPQVLYSPVSPLSPHRMLENSLSSSERLNKAHVTPQKHFTTETPQRHQTLPRSIRNVQRSMSDPKPISPTADDLSKTKLSLCSHETLQNNQFATLPHTSSMRKVKRTLPSPPPEERTLPIVTPAISQMYSSPSTFQRVLPRPTQGPHNTGLLSELRAVEKESSKLRMQQAELEEEEKEIDAKLRYLELGITQRKENLIKERERRELAYIRGMGDARDYMSDSEVNNLGLGRTVYEGSGLLTRPSTAPLSHLSTDQLHSTQYPPTSSFGYQYAQAQPAASPQSLSAYQQIGFQPPQYPPISQSQALPGPFQSHSSPSSTLHAPGSRLFHNVPQSQSSLQTDLGVQQGHQGFHPSSSPVPYASQTLPFSGHTSHQTGQTLSLHAPAEVFTVHQKPRQTSLADLEQKLQTNYEVISSPLVATTTAQSGTYSATFTPTSMANTYGQYQPPEQTLSDRMEPVMDGQTSTYTSEGLYTNLEQNIPRNYVVIDDISELTKENIMPSHRQRTEMHSQYGGESGAPRGSSYNRTEDSKDLFDQSGNTNSTSGYQQHGYGSVTGGSSYYYDDYRRGGQKHQPKNVAPAMTSKRSKHRKQGMEISKFSPIEEARDVESDLASYGMPTSSSGSNTISYRSKKNVADQQQYYGISTRDDLEEEDQVYGSGRSRSTGYGIDKMTSRDSGSYRSKSYERDTVGPQRGEQSRSKHLVRPHNSEEESPLSPVGKPMGTGRSTMRVDSRNQYGSSHSLPDVQDHTKDRPRSHMKKSDDPYLVDDMHCAVSDSEAYHLGQEETDWFEKPRESRSDRSRRSGGGTHSSSHRRSHTKHTYNDYEEPTEEDHWSQEEYTHSRHYSSSSREQRHHGSNSGRHSSTRHTTEESRASRSSRAYPKDPSGRPEPRVSPSAQKKSHESRSSQGQHPSDYHHSSRSQKPGTSTSKRLDTQASLSPGASKPTTEQHHPTPGRPPTPQQQDERHMPDSQMTHPAETGPIPKDQPQVLKQTQAPVQHQTQSQTTSAQAQAPSQQLQSSFTPVPIQTKTEMMSDAPKQETKPAAPQPAKPVQATSTGIGSKAAQRPGGIGSATAGQPPAEGDSMFTKILPGGAAEQAGKLGDAVSAIGKKFTSFW